MKQHQQLNTEQTVFWCPPLPERKSTPLTKLWRPFGEFLSEQDAQTLAVAVNRTLAKSEHNNVSYLMQQWPQWQVSQFNQYRPAVKLPASYLLVILDSQRQSVQHTMLQHALQRCQGYPAGTQVLVVSDKNGAIAGVKTALQRLKLVPTSPIQTLSEPCHHASLLANAREVLVYNSWLGFEALLWQKPVTVFGAPFYARFGLTTDVNLPVASHQITIEQLAYYVLHEHSYSYCPETKQQRDIIAALTWLSWQNQQRQRFPEVLYAIGFNRFWRRSVKLFFQGSKVCFVKHAAKVPANSTAVIWGRKVPVELPHSSALIRIEDGFLRSVGLGAMFTRPLSWVADNQGLYFDATQPSDLEDILSQRKFSLIEVEQAQQLRQWLSANRISKYNTGQSNWQKPVTNKKVILVPGQVETDASIAFGAPGIKKNIELLKTVRQNNPDAYIIYKPHPDVLAGARAVGDGEQHADNYCNEQAENIDISAMLEQVDEVHVLTSLAGFEALLRGIPVFCYGLPFYAGWGLTTDVTTCNRRTRTLKLDELVAGCLICYPLYIGKNSGFYNSALATAEALAAWRTNPKQQTTAWQKMLRMLLRKCLNFIRGKH